MPRSLRNYTVVVVTVAVSFAIWRADSTRHPVAKIAELGTAVAAPTAQSLPAAPIASAPLIPPTTSANEDDAQDAKVLRLTFGSQWKQPVEGAPELLAFANWTDRYLATPPLQRAPLVAEGAALAQSRRNVFGQLIRTRPELAIAATVPIAVLAELPTAVTGLLEQRVSGEGNLSLIGTSPAPGSTDVLEPTFRTASINGQFFRAHVYGRREQQTSKVAISLHGVAQDGHVAISDSPVRVLERAEITPAVAAAAVTNCPISGLPTAVPGTSRLDSLPGACGPIIQVGPRVEVLCCAAHVGTTESQLIGAENSAGPYPGALSERAFIEAANAAGSEVQTSGALYPASWTEGTKKVLVMLVDFSDLPGVPVDTDTSTAITPTTVLDDFYGPDSPSNYHYGSRNVNGFFQSCSYGQTSLALTAGDITPVMRMPKTAAYYSTQGDGAGNAGELHSAAETLATNAGYAVANYDRLVLIFHDLSGISGSQITYGGLGNIGGEDVWINGYPVVLEHELGHTYGLQHGNLYQTTDGSVTGTGSSIEYGDPTDVMGDSYNGAEYNMWSRNLLGWIPDSSVTNITTSGTYRVYRFDSANATTSGALALKIPGVVAGDNLHDYWIGLREQNPVHGDPNLYNSAYIFWGYHYSRQSDLLDMNTPGSNAGDAALQVGQTFSEKGITIKVLDVGGSDPDQYLDVQVTFANFVEFAASNVTVDESSGTATITLYRMGNSTGTVSVNYSTSNGTASAPSAYTAASGTVTWANGDTTPKTITIQLNPGAVASGTASFNLTLSGAAGGIVVGGSTATVQIAAPGALESTYAAALASGSYLYASGNPLPQADGTALFFLGKWTGSFYGYHLARFDAYGVLSDPFSSASVINEEILLAAQQPDGKILVAGYFTAVDGTAVNGFARLNADGTLDKSFLPPAALDAEEFGAIVVQPDGKILIGSVASDNMVVRLNSDGSVDAGFTPPTNYLDHDFVSTIALQPDGKILVAGQFYFPYNATYHVYPSSVMRLNGDGTLDPAFYAGTSFAALGSINYLIPVDALAVQSDGSIVVGGGFGLANGIARTGLARLHADGTLDAAFDPVLTGSSSYPAEVQRLVLQSDGRVVAEGSITAIGGVAVNDGMGRVKADGTFDSSFAPAAASLSDITSIRAAVGGSLLISSDSNNYGLPLSRMYMGVTTKPGAVQFASASVTAVPGGNAVLQVTRTGGTDNAVSIDYGLQSGTALAGTAFTPQIGTLKWAAGDSAPKTITIPISANAAGPDITTFKVNLAVPIGGVFPGAITSAAVNVNGPAGLTPTITSSLAATATLNYAFTYQIAATASPTMYGATNLPDGLTIDTSTGIISGSPAALGVFDIGISAGNAASTANETLELTVTDAPTATLTATINSVTLGSGGFAQFTLGLSAPLGQDLVIAYAIKGSAINGTDYTLITAMKKIKAGKTSKVIKIYPQGNLGGATKKQIILELLPGNGYVVGTVGKVKAKIIAP